MMLRNIIFVMALTGCAANNQALVRVPPNAVVVDGVVHQADAASLSSGTMMLNGKQYQLGQAYRYDQPIYSAGGLNNNAITATNPLGWMSTTLQLIGSILTSIRLLF